MTAAVFAMPGLLSTGPPQLADIITTATLDVLSRDGASAFEASREAAIAHETGHAVVATHEFYQPRPSVRPAG